MDLPVFSDFYYDIAKLRSYLFISFIAAALLLIPAISSAEIRESDGILFGRKQENLIRETSDKGFGPAGLSGKEVYVIAYLGGAYGTVLVLGSSSADPKKLATVLDGWLHAQGSDARVQWSQDEDGPAAAFKLGNLAHIGLLESQTTLDFGSIVHAYQVAGYRPYPIGRTGTYTDLEGAGKSFGGSGSKLYDLSSLPETGKISVHAHMSAPEAVLLVVWPFFVPLVALLGFMSAALYGRRESVPIAKRRQTYQKLVLGSAFGSIGIHAVSFIGLMSTGGLGKVCDLWFGTSSTVALIPMIPLGFVFILPILIFNKSVEKRLFGADPQAQIALAPQSAAEKAFVMRKVAVSLFVTLVLFSIYLAIVFNASPKDSSTRLIAMPFLFFGILAPRLVSGLMGKGSAEFEVVPADADLTNLGREIAERIQVKPPKLLVSKTRIGRTYISGSALAGRVTVSQRAVEVLTREEMSFLLAHELAHLKQSDGNRRLLMMTPGLVVILGLQFYVFATPPPHPPWVLPVAFGFLIAYAFGAGYWLRRTSRHSEFDADRLAVEATGDPASAISCLEKCAQYSALPHIHDLETARHPSIQRRIEALGSAPT